MGHVIRVALAALLTVLLAAAFAHGGLIETSPQDFAVLAGGALQIDQHAAIDGLAGALGNVRLDRGVAVRGGAYTLGTFHAAREVLIDGPVVAGGNVRLDKQAVAGRVASGANVALARDVTVTGPVAAARRLHIDRDSLVRGDASYGTEAQVHASATIEGDLGRDLLAIDTWSPTLMDEPAAWQALPGSTHHAHGADVTLAPDTYGGLHLDRDGTLRLTAGTYDLGSVRLDRGTRVVADTSAGDVLVAIAGSLNVDRDTVFETTGGGSLVFLADSSVCLGRGVQADASFYSFGNLGVEADAHITGRLYSAGNLWMGQNVEVQGPANPAYVPEPATLALVLAGAGILGRRRRR